MNTPYDILIHDIHIAGETHVDLKQISNRWEELKKIKLARLKAKYYKENPKHSQAMLEMLAYADQEYEAFIDLMLQAQSDADKAEIYYDSLKNKLDAMRSHMAFEREKLSKGITHV